MSVTRDKRQSQDSKPEAKRPKNDFIATRLKKAWAKTVVGKKRGELGSELIWLEEAVSLITFDLGVRLRIIREHMRRNDTPSARELTKHCREIERDVDVCEYLALHLIGRCEKDRS